jgi:hypothetical protein
MIRAGIERIGLLLNSSHRGVYEGLLHSDEFWREEADMWELNGFVWLRKKIEKWGCELNRG